MNRKLKIVIESHIPYIRGVVERHGAQAVYLAPEEFTPEAVADADAIIVRTRTHANADLLAGSRCSLVATATIGTDHIDLRWCADAGIEVANAPGCNAPAVAQYVLTSVLTLEPDALTKRPVMGVVGVGHVGGIVARWARSLGFEVLECDPPRSLAEGPERFVTLDEIARRADIITFHTPLTSAPAPFPTRHLADEAFFASLSRRPIVVNSARGPVTDTAAMLEASAAGLTGPLVIDCWEGEPAIDRRLLAEAAIATPHIAGYSAQGKVRATQMALDAVSRHFGLPPMEADALRPLPVADAISLGDLATGWSPLDDTAALRACPGAFERLRNGYALRREPLQT